MGRAENTSHASNDDVYQIEAKSCEATLLVLLYTYLLNLLKINVRRLNVLIIFPLKHEMAGEFSPEFEKIKKRKNMQFILTLFSQRQKISKI